jgi:hypothetical protein
MAYYIFLKSLKILEEFWKYRHIKISPKSPCTISKAFVNSKKYILFPKGIPPSFRPNRPNSQPAHSAFWPTRPHSSSSRTEVEHASHHRRPASRHPHGCPRLRPLKGKSRRVTRPSFPHYTVPPPLFNPLVIGAFNLGALKLLQRQPLKAPGLPCLASAL